MPINMVDANGVVRSIPDDEVAAAIAQGFKPESIDDSATRIGREVKEEQYGGIGGKAQSLAAGVARGVTLGGSDLIGEALGFGADLQALKEVNPITSTVGEIGGGVAASFASPSSLLGKMPAGYLARASNEASALARAAGGIKGIAGSLAATGTEAAAQNAGMYLSDVALGNRQLTAEGLGGALGTGFVFGTAAGGAVLGIEKGAMAARRMFANVMDGGADATRSAVGEWERRSTELFDANRQTLDAAKQQLDEARAAAEQAQFAQQQARQQVIQERLQASRAVPDEPFVPTPPELLAPQVPQMPGVPARAGAALDEVLDAPVLAQTPTLPSAAPKLDAGVPDYASLTKHLDDTGDDYLEATVDAKAIADRGYYEPAGGHGDAVRTANAKKAITEGQREPIKLGITEAGKITVMDGRHRLAAAIEAGKPIKVKWTTSSEPAPDEVFRGAGKASDSAPANAPPPPPVAEPSSVSTAADDLAFAGKLPEHFGSLTPRMQDWVSKNPEYVKWQNTVKRGLDADQSDAVSAYSNGMSYIPINKMLRGGEALDPKFASELNKTIRGLDSTMSANKLPRDMELVRGVHSGPGVDHYAKYKVGDTFEDQAFVSTSLDPNIYPDDRVRMTIMAPKGTPAVPVFGGVDTYHEMEVLLNRGMKYRVVGREDVPTRGVSMMGDPIKYNQVQLKLEVVPSGAAAAPVKTASSFADDVFSAAERASKYGKDKAFVSSIYENMPEASRGTLADFKRKLIKAQADDQLHLARADLVDAMDPKLVEASEISDLGADFHFVKMKRPKAVANDVSPSHATQADPPRPMSDDDLEVARQNFQESTSPHEFMSVADYQGGFYGQVNRTLRGHPKADDLQAADHVAEITRNLDSVLDKNRLADPVVLYRGSPSLAELDNLKPGDVYVDKTFMSTSTDPKRIRDADVVFHISAPAGTRAGALIRDTSNHRGGYLLEKEMLLDRETALRLDRVEKQKHYKFGDEITVMHFTVVGQRGEKAVVSETLDVAPASAGHLISSAQPPMSVSAQKLAAAVAEAEDAESVLMQKLMGTKARVDSGEALSSIGTQARAQPLSPKQLEDAYDEVIEQAAEAVDIDTKQALLRKASEIEQQLAGGSPKALDDVDSVAQAMSRYEKAMADLADEMGDAAHPTTREMSDAVRSAESDVDRKMLDRATHMIDDHADQYGPFEQVGPQRKSPKDRIAYAKERKLEADVAAGKARGDVATAKQAYGRAKEQAAATKQAAETVSLQASDVAPQPGRFAGLGSLGTGLELAGMAGIPGLPKPSDLPIVGPVLGLWLKMRALKGGADRLMGRVPATGNARAAALANQTRDRAAKVVDKMLGLVERKAPAARSAAAVVAPRLIDAVRNRVFDDGTASPDKDAGLTDHAAARIREIDSLVTNPALITAQIRRELRDVADPDTVAAAIQFRTKQLQYLHDNAPKEPPPSPFVKGPWKPNKSEATDFARRFAVAMDPVVALEQVEQRTLTPEAAEAFRNVYPLIYAQTQQRLLSKAVELKQSLPRQQLIRMSILFDIPLDSALEPTSLASFQAALAPSSPAATAQQPSPAPSPSIAGGVALTSVYQTPADRRAAM